jgi:hypothetical protein
MVVEMPVGATSRRIHEIWNLTADGWARVSLEPAESAAEALRTYLRRVGGPADLVRFRHSDVAYLVGCHQAKWSRIHAGLAGTGGPPAEQIELSFEADTIGRSRIVGRGVGGIGRGSDRR